MTAELLAVARHEQQRVVGRGAHDQDEQDPLGLPVEVDDSFARQVEHDDARSRESEHGAEDDEERQCGAAVDEQQDDQHGGQRDAEQDAVDLAEGLAEVGAGPRGAGDVAHEALRQARAVGVANGVHEHADGSLPVGERLLHRRAVEGQQQQDGLTVLRRDQGDAAAAWRLLRGGVRLDQEVTEHDVGEGVLRRPDGHGQLRQAGGELGHALQLLGREPPVGRLHDHEGGEGLVVGEPGAQVADVGRLDAVGQERGGVVLLHLGQPALERPADRRHGQPDEQQQRRDDPAQP